MTVCELIKLLEKYDPSKRIGITYADSWGTFFKDGIHIEEITIDSNDSLEYYKNQPPLTKVLEIS